MKRLSVSRLQISPSAEGCGKTEFSFYRVSRNVPLIQNHRGNSVHFTITILSPQNALLSLTYSPRGTRLYRENRPHSEVRKTSSRWTWLCSLSAAPPDFSRSLPSALCQVSLQRTGEAEVTDLKSHSSTPPLLIQVAPGSQETPADPRPGGACWPGPEHSKAPCPARLSPPLAAAGILLRRGVNVPAGQRKPHVFLYT